MKKTKTKDRDAQKKRSGHVWNVSGTFFPLTLRLLPRWPSLDGVWRQNFFAAATTLSDCYLLYSCSGPCNGLSI